MSAQRPQLVALTTRTDNYTYLIFGAGTDELWVIDPGEAFGVLKWCAEKNLQVTHIICTHHHYDHVDGIAELLNAFSVRDVICSPVDLPRIQGATRAWPEGETLRIAGEAADSMMIPGHTQGHMAVFLPKTGWLFCGDTLFAMGCGRLLEGTAEQLFTSLQQLKTLPTQTELYWGHEYTKRNLEFALSVDQTNVMLHERAEKLNAGGATLPGRLSEELDTNPFLRAPSLESFRELRRRRDTW